LGGREEDFFHSSFVPNMFPMVPIRFPICGPNVEAPHLCIESSILGSFHNFHFFVGPIKSAHCKKKKVGLVTHPQVAAGQSVTTSSTNFSFQNLGFSSCNQIFSCRNHLKINISHILNPNLTKSISLNPTHQDLSNNTKGTFY
jgi:hypothetical protein